MPSHRIMPPLRRADLAPDPLAQFAAWWADAVSAVPLAEAVTLATVDADGMPDARMVLLKGFDAAGFRFHTNYESTKGRQLAGSPRAAMVAYWRELDRQVRLRGMVERLGAAESDAYFASRPVDRRVGAWASPQSRPLRERADLDARVRDVEARFAGADIPRPAWWGGYLLRPQTVEFWQGQTGRLHDRFRYTRDGDGWRLERLAP